MPEKLVVPTNSLLNYAKILIFSLFFTACEYNKIEITSEGDCINSSLTLSVLQSEAATDCADESGYIEVIANGGIPPYVYAIGNSPFQTSNVFNQLGAGSYTIVVKDVLSCSDTLTHHLSGFESQLAATATIFPDSLCLSNTFSGLIKVNVIDGAPPYLFQINDQALTNDSTFDQLKHGIYTVRVIDNSQCNYQLDVNVPRKTSGVSWRNEVKPIIDISCAKAGCHDDVSGRTSLKSFEGVKGSVNQIRQRIVNRSMPFDLTLPDQQIQLIVCWIDDGADEN